MQTKPESYNSCPAYNVDNAGLSNWIPCGTEELLQEIKVAIY